MCVEDKEAVHEDNLSNICIKSWLSKLILDLSNSQLKYSIEIKMTCIYIHKNMQYKKTVFSECYQI